MTDAFCDDVHRLSRYEVARLIGMRALELYEGAPPNVQVDASLTTDPVYVATFELFEKKIDAYIRRRDGTCVHVPTSQLPPEVAVSLDTRDNGTRSITQW